MIAQYKPNEQDLPILAEITAVLQHSLAAWYGQGARLDSAQPEIRSYRNCFMLRYPISRASGERKTVLVKIRRNPKMEALWQAVEAQIHENIPNEYSSLEYVFSFLAGSQDGIGVIRPLQYIEKYHAIVMEEYPSQTLRSLLVRQRTSHSEDDHQEFLDAASKTGKWLHYFHHHMHVVEQTPYTTADLLEVVEGYAQRLQEYSYGRVNAQGLVEAFARKLKNVQLQSLPFSQSHADMTCDNVLYSYDKKVCVIDIKTRLAPIYSDLGLILTHPETFKPQIFSGGTYLREPLLGEYRDAILAGYFEHEEPDDLMVKLFSAIKVLDKWSMYEELMKKYKGAKRLLSIPVGPFVTHYFQGVLQKHLDGIPEGLRQPDRPVAKPADPSPEQTL